MVGMATDNMQTQPMSQWEINYNLFDESNVFVQMTNGRVGLRKTIFFDLKTIEKSYKNNSGDVRLGRTGTKQNEIKYKDIRMGVAGLQTMCKR